MVRRKCTNCGQKKNIKKFYQRKRGERAGKYYEICKECYKIRGRAYYFKNHDRQLSLAKLRKRKYIGERKIWLEKVKNRPCVDCGKIYSPWVMDFDHKDGGKKGASISWLAIHNTSNIEKIEKEIAKCDLVCANCHRERTHQRLQKNKDASVANVVKAAV